MLNLSNIVVVLLLLVGATLPKKPKFSMINNADGGHDVILTTAAAHCIQQRPQLLASSPSACHCDVSS